MIFKLSSIVSIESNQTVVRMRCPNCRQRGTFESTLKTDISQSNNNLSKVILGQRRCPDPNCYAQIFVAYDRLAERVIVSYPAERIDFDSTDIPTSVLKTLEEAITCHASQCYVACAIMIRKTLEELCKERGATGKNLKIKLQDLRGKIILPQELLDGLDDLRLLGNDAAHIEAQEYRAFL